jgi:putative tryptophan/tyrosine transport system substrate-binding protein
MRRREFVALLGSIAVAWAAAAHAQQRTAKIGVLWQADSLDEQAKAYLNALAKTLGDLGYVEGKTTQFVHRFSGDPSRFRELAKELVDNKPDVIVAVTQLGALELKQFTATIPIVLVLVSDPVGTGLIESLSHPGGNITGLSLMAVDTTSKRLGFLKEAVPSLRRIAQLGDPKDPAFATNLSSYLDAAKSLGLELRAVEIPTPATIAETFSTIAKNGFDGAVVVGAMMFNERARVGAAALAEKMPTATFAAEAVPFGLLLSYGNDYSEYFRKAAGYVDKILKGASPADLPVEQPTRLKLVVNLRTAKALGLNLPSSLIVAADEVIE